MNVKEVTAKSILRKRKKIDSWFISKYGMNLYRGCSHNCVYCDGRSENYYVEGDFGNDIEVKVNAVEILEKELARLAKKQDLTKNGFFMIGGGVSDSYQHLEKEYEITKNVLDLFLYYNAPVRILTKNDLVLRDIEFLKKINNKSRAVVSFSFSTTDNEIASIFEPNASTPEQRLKAMKILKDAGIYVGAYLLPVIPFVTDSFNEINKSLFNLKSTGVDFVIFGGMTLKNGKQRDYYTNVLKKYYPDKINEYEIVYKNDKWGQADWNYYLSIGKTFEMVNKKYGIKERIPTYVYNDIVNENDLVIVILENIDFILKSRGQKSPYGFAAHSISNIKKPVSEMRDNLRSIKGVGRFTEKLILEILDTGKCRYLENIIRF